MCLSFPPFHNFVTFLFSTTTRRSTCQQQNRDTTSVYIKAQYHPANVFNSSFNPDGTEISSENLNTKSWTDLEEERKHLLVVKVESKVPVKAEWWELDGSQIQRSTEKKSDPESSATCEDRETNLLDHVTVEPTDSGFIQWRWNTKTPRPHVLSIPLIINDQ